MKSILLVIGLFISTTAAQAQYRSNNWVLGDSIKVHFDNQGIPTVNTTNVNAYESISSISDSTGRLLFYASGGEFNGFSRTYIYNDSAAYMSNSSLVYGHYSNTGGIIILPLPDSDSLFYIFAIGDSLGLNKRQVYYSIVDRILDNGHGAVILKNALLCDTVPGEQLAAVKHANGRDWWLLFHGASTDYYFVYLISPTGISSPLIQHIGLVLGTTYGCVGEMVFSEDGSKMVHASLANYLQLMDFDRCTGILSNLIQLGGPTLTTQQEYYGCSFSSIGTKLYASTFDSIFQYDLTSTSIINSKIVLCTLPQSGYNFGQHQLGENGKIYISCRRSSAITDSLTSNLTVINAPDSAGMSCDIAPFSFSLNGRRIENGLPNCPNYNLGPVAGSTCDSLSTGLNYPSKQYKLTAYPTPANEIIFYNIPDGSRPLQVKLFSLNGTLALEQKMPSITEVDVHDLSSGLYLLLIVTGNGNTYSKKVVIEN